MKVIFLDVDGVLNSAQDGYSIRLKTDSHLKLLQEGRGGLVMAIRKKHTKYSKYKKESGNAVSEAKVSNINLTEEQKRLAGLGIIVNMSPPPFLRIDESTKKAGSYIFIQEPAYISQAYQSRGTKS